MLTPEEKKLIEEELGEEWRRKIEMLEEEAVRGRQLEAELIGELQKIYSNPEAKRAFRKALEKAGVKIDIPESPLDVLEDKVTKTEKELEKFKKMQEEREKILKALQEYGITEKEYDDLIEFQKQYKIADNLKAIELYAMFKKSKTEELAPVKKISIKSPEEYTEEEAYKKTYEDLKKLGLL